MRFRRTIAILLTVAFAAVTAVSVAVLLGEEKDTVSVPEPEPMLITFWGDSIAEGVLGPSPLKERDSYAYFAVVGRDNGYIYRNRSVSGHQTSHMLEYIKQPDENAYMNDTLLRTSDIIHISILGNDLLQNSLGSMVVNYAKGNTASLDSNVARARANFTRIMDYIEEVNPDAFVMINTVYNPMFEGSVILPSSCIDEMHAMGMNEEEIRATGTAMLAELNGIIFDYLEEHENAYVVIDAEKEFDRIFREDEERGKGLLYNDGVHPSNEGHAVIADLIQRALEKAGLADEAKALANYKKLRTEQLARLYAGTADTTVNRARIADAASVEEVTDAYFRATDGYTPVYYD